MTLQIRDFAPADAEAAAAAYQAGRPHLVTSPEVIAWQVRTMPPELRFRVLLAELDGVVVGTARAALNVFTSVPGQANLNVSVLPEHRGRGAGAALLAAGEAYLRALGAARVHCWADDEPRALAFAERHDYRVSRTSRFSRLDLTGPLPAVPPVPPGVELRSATDFLDDPSPIFRIDYEGSLDEPGDLVADAMDFQGWYDTFWSRPDQHRELTVVAVVAGEPAAFTAAQTYGATRYWSGGTSTRAAYRGRGLAKLAKAESLHRAHAAGLTEAYTDNDATNGPMLAINTWLGYRPCATERGVVKDLI